MIMKSSFLSSLFLYRESHLPSIIPQQEDHRRKNHHQDEVKHRHRLRKSFWTPTAPNDEDNLQEEKKNGELNFPSDEMAQFQSVIDPPGEESGDNRKRRSDRTKKEQIETGGLKSGFFEKKMEDSEE
jgi:hypothetical protein